MYIAVRISVCTLNYSHEILFVYWVTVLNFRSFIEPRVALTLYFHLSLSH